MADTNSSNNGDAASSVPPTLPPPTYAVAMARRAKAAADPPQRQSKLCYQLGDLKDTHLIYQTRFNMRDTITWSELPLT